MPVSSTKFLCLVALFHVIIPELRSRSMNKKSRKWIYNFKWIISREETTYKKPAQMEAVLQKICSHICY
jgi:hypothetical protein